MGWAAWRWNWYCRMRGCKRRILHPPYNCIAFWNCRYFLWLTLRSFQYFRLFGVERWDDWWVMNQQWFGRNHSWPNRVISRNLHGGSEKILSTNSVLGEIQTLKLLNTSLLQPHNLLGLVGQCMYFENIEGNVTVFCVNIDFRLYAFVALHRRSKYNVCCFIMMNVWSNTMGKIALSVNVIYRSTLHTFNITSTSLFTRHLKSVYTEAVTQIRHSLLLFYLLLSYLLCFLTPFLSVSLFK
jgi:hypothetical protein